MFFKRKLQKQKLLWNGDGGAKGGDGGSTFEIGTMVTVIFDHGILPNRKLFP